MNPNRKFRVVFYKYKAYPINKFQHNLHIRLLTNNAFKFVAELSQNLKE